MDTMITDKACGSVDVDKRKEDLKRREKGSIGRTGNLQRSTTLEKQKKLTDGAM